MKAARPASIASFYVLYFASVGIILPFLPAYLASHGIDAARIGGLLAISPALTLLAPSWWGHLADRSGRPGRVLALMSVGACAGFAPLMVSSGALAAAACLAAYAFFASGMTAIADGIALHSATAAGGSFSRIRLWGSLGFIAASVSFGALGSAANASAVVVPVALMAAYAVAAASLGAQTAPSQGEASFAGLRLLGRRDLLLFLVATALHWIACAPYNGMLALHVTALGLPLWVVGLSAGVGVVAEVAVMFHYPAIAARLSPRRVLALAFAGSALRWAGMAVASGPFAVVALNVFHGLTFGAFYVASIGFVSARVPEGLRARGQALFASFTFGLGGLVGFSTAGAAYERWGGHRLFAAAVVVELAAALVLGVAAAGRPAAELAAPSRAP